MMILMPKKPAKKPKTHISFRLSSAELEPLDADRKALPGVPVARNTYAKHAVTQYPKLRKLEGSLRDAIRDNPDGIETGVVRDLLKEAGL